MANANSPTSAKTVAIHTLDHDLLDEKIRIAGMSLSYDYEHQVLLVHDTAMHACLVDASLVLDSLISIPGLRESKTIVVIIGYLEYVEDGLPIPTVPAFVDAPIIDPTLIIRAIFITPSPDLDLSLWEHAMKVSGDEFDDFDES